MSTYREIMTLAGAMHDESTLSKRREAGRRLEQRLSSPRVRYELALEAGANRQQALAELWKYIIQNAIAFVNKILKSKSKITQADILIGFSLIKCCDLPNESVTPEEAKYQGTFRLTRKEMRMTLNFCLELLNDEDALSVAELDLLDMLAYLAGHRGYMSYLKSQNEIQVILEEVESRISDESLSHSIRQKAGEIFQNLCFTTKSLGIEMTTLVAGSVKMVAGWCSDVYRAAQNNNGAGSIAEMSPLIEGLVTMVRSNPEQAIAPLTRHGRAILKLAKWRYRRIADRAQRHVLNQYFMCHLIVAQTAGELRGLMPGDLGDLGEAALTPRLIDDLLQLVMGRSGDLPVSSRAMELETVSLDAIQQTQLELAARLFACAQRIALSQLEREQMGNQTQLLTTMIAKMPKPGDLPRVDDRGEVFAPPLERVVTDTPFMKYVLSEVYHGALQVLSSRPSKNRHAKEEDHPLPIISALNAATCTNDCRSPVDKTATRILLQIIAACAEAFPAGGCWASRSLSCWFRIPIEGKHLSHHRHVHGCDARDLAAVISVVCSILDGHGGHNGDNECQKWALRCIIRLADATSCLTLVDRKCDSSVLGKVWKDVWYVLFRPDLRYSAYTAYTSADSVAELVLRALSAMILNLCTDPNIRWCQGIRERRSTFMYRQQGDVWNLPVFSLVGEMTSLVPFDVIVNILETVGLGEGPDSIAQGLRYKGFGLKTVPDDTRRHRLVNFCLGAINLRGNGNSMMVGAASTSVAALIHGRESDWSMSLQRVCSDLPVLNCFCCQRVDTNRRCLLDVLWVKQNSLSLSLPVQGTWMDPVLNCHRQLDRALLFGGSSLASVDILASSQSASLFDAVIQALDLSLDIQEASDDPEWFLAVEDNARMLKVKLTALLCRKKSPMLEKALDQLAPSVVDFMHIVTTKSQIFLKDHPSLILETQRIVEFLVLVSSFELLDLPHSVLDLSHDLAEELEKYLNLYSRDEHQSWGVEDRPSSMGALDLDADDLEDRIEGKEKPGNTRKRQRPEHGPSVRKRSRAAHNLGSHMKDALNVVRLLFSLKPSLRTIRFAAEKLLGVDMEKSLPYYDESLMVDPLMAACLAQMFNPFLRAQDTGTGTGGDLLCRLVLMTRSNSPPHSPLHLFGYEECARFCLDDGWEGLRSQTQSDSDELLSMWTNLSPAELRSRSLRPGIRAIAVKTLSAAFVGGDQVVKAQWEKAYPKQILPVMFDLNSEVRIRGAIGVALSLHAMESQEKVLESMTRNLAPASSERSDFKKWYNSVSSDGGLAVQQAWEDLRGSVEFVALLSMSLVGGRASGRAQQEQILFKILEVAGDRCDLEAACFMVTDLFATVSGFDSAETMLSDCLEGMVERWLSKSHREGVPELPLLMSAPNLLRFLIENSSFCCWQDSGDIDINYVREHSTKEFFVRNPCLILPRLLGSLTDPAQPDEALLGFCSMYGEDEPKEIIKKLIRGNISSLTAYSALREMLSVDSDKLATNLSQVIQHYVDEDDLSRLRRCHISSTSKYFFQQASNAALEIEDNNTFYKRSSEKFTELVRAYGDSGDGCLFQKAGLTLSECCILSRVWCCPNTTDARWSVEWVGEKKIQSIKVLWTIAKACPGGRRADFQLDYLFLLFSEFFMSCSFPRLLSDAMELLKDVILHFTNVGTSPRITWDSRSKLELRALFCSVWRLYEENRASLLNHSSTFSRLRRVLRKRVSGLAAHSFLASIDIDFIDEPEAIVSAAESKEKEIHDILNMSSEVLQLVSEHCHHLGLDYYKDLDPLVSFDMSENDMALLEQLGHKFSHSDLKPHVIPGGLKSTPELYDRLISSTPYFVARLPGSGRLTPHQHLLVSELRELLMFLTERETSELMPTDAATLLQRLSELCFDSPDEICAIASRCIGALQIRDFEQHEFSSIAQLQSDIPRDGQLEPFLEARSIGLLIDLVKSPGVYSGLIAMETIKRLLSTKAGTEREQYARLPVHFSPSEQVGASSLVLEKSEMKTIKAFFVGKETWTEWCWDEAFWVSCLECEFEIWICNLVPAILACHYSGHGKNGASSDTGRLLHCQRMSFIEPKFASSLFPLLIIQLLREQQSNKVTSFTEIQSDTWIGDPDSPITLKISKCFAAVFQKCNERPKLNDSRAVGLLVDTLDMIRRSEQHRFLNSNGHTRNPTNMKAFVGSTGSLSSPPSQGTPSSQSQDYTQTFNRVKWTGIPFGVGLFISGIALAEVCLKVKRYFSAIFYAEHYADVRFGGSTRNVRKAITGLSKDLATCAELTSDISGFTPGMSSNLTSSDPMQLIEEAKSYLEVLMKCSQALGESDHLDAILSSLSDVGLMGEKPDERWQENHLTPTEALRLNDSFMTSTLMPEQRNRALDCLSQLRLYGTLQTSIEGLATRASVDGIFSDNLRDKWFEGCLFGNSLDSFNSHSDITHRISSSNQTSGFCESIFTALLCLSVDDYDICKINVENARFSSLEGIVDVATIEASPIATISLVDKLSCLNDLEAVIANQGSVQNFPPNWNMGGEPSTMLERSSLAFLCRDTDQPFSDRIQELVLKHMSTQQGESGERAKKLLSSLLWRNADKACRNLNVGDAQEYFQRLSHIDGSDPCTPEFFRVRHLEARILKTKGDFSSAIRHVIQSLDRLELFPLISDQNEIRADLLVCCGRWLAAHRVDSGENVLSKFLRPGLDLARRINNENPSTDAARRVTEACITLGDLVFSIYETVSSRVQAPEWRAAGLSLRAREAELQEYEMMMADHSKKGKSRPSQEDWEQWLKELMMFKMNLSKDIHQIRNERDKIERSIDEYKDLAMQTFIEALSVADDTYGAMSKYIYRIFGIWFSSREEGDVAGDPTGLERIPSYRFVSLSNQLFARLSQSNVELTRLAKRLCLDHPYHCLGQMVRLGIDNPSANARDKEKAAVAIEILQYVKTESADFLLHLVDNYESVIRAYIFLADASTEEFLRGKSKKIRLSALYKGNAAPRLDQCIGVGSRRKPCPPCVLTKPPLLRPQCDYGEGVDDPIGGERIDKFEDHFSVAESGITRPKIAVCIGSKGGRFKQLVKGKDDCRGDAVMEQVFEYVNALLAQKKTGRDNHMRIVTYTIVPTSPTTGVLEWVEDTIPFGDYLNDKGKKGSAVGAHSRYFPGEWGSNLCRDYLKNAPPKQRREAFEIICKYHSPAFRFFFVERFRNSAHEWYKAKTRYTRSVAVSSFVGHILGIGDRHSNNILVHEKTGEVVHIDFGIVFEQGKLLQMPERVPFRLTRNVVDGFGPAGTNGRFTTTSRQTMKALKQNAESLLTILSAISADPLYRWSLNPKVERKRQEMLARRKVAQADTDARKPAERANSNKDQNETAKQAVRKVKEKLSGYEDGTAGEQQSIEGQVHFLINAARDFNLLSQMYPGWAPWS